jgi:hypothetical protein
MAWLRASTIGWINGLGLSWVGFWTGLASLAAAASAGFAAWQLRSARLQTTRATAFEHFREIDGRLRDLWSADIGAVQNNIIRAYKGEAALTDDDKLYLVFLNSLDLLAFARAEGVSDRKLIDRYIPTLLRSNTITVDFLRQFQECCTDHQVYEHLSALLQEPTILESIRVKETALGASTATTPAVVPASSTRPRWWGPRRGRRRRR